MKTKQIVMSQVESIETPSRAGSGQVSAPPSDASKSVTTAKPAIVKLNKYKAFDLEDMRKFIARAEGDAGEIAILAKEAGLTVINEKDTVNGEAVPLGTQRALGMAGLLGDKARTKQRLDQQASMQALKLAFIKCGFIRSTGN